MDLPDAIERIRPAVIQLQVGDDQGNHVPIGTGFLVGRDGLAITARHVADSAESIVSDNAGARLLAALATPNIDEPIHMRANFEVVPCEVVERDDRHDLALVRLQTNPFATGRPSGMSRSPDGGFAINALYGEAELSQRQPRDGDGIAVSGYPLTNAVLITTTGVVASAWSTDREEAWTPADSYVADVAVNPGNSGGPVFFAADGAVIGVCVAFQIAAARPEDPFFYNSGLTTVVPVKYVVDLIGRYDARGRG